MYFYKKAVKHIVQHTSTGNQLYEEVRQHEQEWAETTGAEPQDFRYWNNQAQTLKPSVLTMLKVIKPTH